ncbi:MAG: chromosomal replication initiator protein DnaA [Candidatus Hydrogenedentes bacterium]|nr:chromosomal replication initiator protein DnaA [Candidatus Hydrogenedentota bacterium]
MASASKANPWEQAQTHLQTALDDYSYKNWFSQTRYESCSNGKLTVGVPSQFFADWLRDHYMDAVCDSLRKVMPDFDSVSFIPRPGHTAEPMGSRVPSAASLPQGPAPSVDRAPVGVKQNGTRRIFNGFNPRYTFDRFVIGSGNRFAHAAARAVAESPGRAYNPLFLYGGTGLGKTHLMQGIGQYLMSQRPELRCVFISSENFTNQLIQSIAEKSTQKFRNKFRKVDVLLIDDIQFISGKEATQEEFFHTFNVLFDMHKQIVLCSDRSPKEIRGIEERLISRFEWGLVTDIQPPDLETRVAILQRKAQDENLTVPNDVMRYIATYITTNIRELEGALITVLAYSRLTEEKITITMVEEVLRDLIGAEKIRPVTIEQVQRAVADHFDVRISDLHGRSRQRQIVKPRQLAMYLCKELIPSLSLNDVGVAFGGKDHTTVLYACDKVSGEVKDSANSRQMVEQLTKTIRS